MRRVAVHLLALWVALCCCQWKALASALGMNAAPACCAAEQPSCCRPENVAPSCCDMQQDMNQAGDEPCHDGAPEPSGKGRCGGCCDKALDHAPADPLAEALTRHVDLLGTLLMVTPADAIVASAACIAGSVWHPPPDRVLPLLCILTV